MIRTFFENILDNNTVAIQCFLDKSARRKRVVSLGIVYAAALDNAEMVEIMLAADIDVNTVDILTSFKRTWESTQLKELQMKIERDVNQYTRKWAPMVTPACIAAFYGYKDVLAVICKHDPSAFVYDPYTKASYTYLGNGKPPTWNALTCALFGQQWDIATALVYMGLLPTSMVEQYPRFLEFRTKVRIPKDVINVVFSFL